MLTRPVDAITVERQPGSAGWVAVAGQPDRHWALWQLIETVVAFSTAKQAAVDGWRAAPSSP